MKIPYGNADFGSVRRGGMFYVDKTPYLAELENDEFGYSKVVFLRPRRFGKSSFISMMAHYYDIATADQYDELFRGLWVYEHPTPNKNNYLVLHLNFSTVSTDGGEDLVKFHFLKSVHMSVVSLAQRYCDRIPRLNRFLEREVSPHDDPASLMTDLIGTIAGTRYKLYVMVDEYDTFSNALLSENPHDVYTRVTGQAGFVRAFYRTLKAGADMGAIARVFITGATPILLDDLVTGFNISTNISNHAQFNAMAGFTHADVERALDELLASRPELAKIEGMKDRSALLDVLERHYDGYRFSEDASERVFNSNLINYFLREVMVRRKFPQNMLDPNARTDYKKLHALWTAAGPAAEERRGVLEKVLDKGHIWSDLVEQFGVRTTATTSQFVSLMYYTGMLTLSSEPSKGDYLRFEIPNRVIRELGWQHYTSLLQDLDSVSLMNQPMGLALIAMAEEGTLEPFLERFRKDVVTALSLKDFPQYNEKSMKMLLMGTMLMSSVFYVLTEREFAQGYNDLFLTPTRGIRDAKFAWMIELKYLKSDATHEDQANAFAQAEAQLRKYASDQQLVPMLTRGLQMKAGTLLFVGLREVQWREWLQPGG